MAESPLNVLQVCTSRSWGGMEMQTLNTALALRAGGHVASLLCYPDSPLYQEARSASLPTLPMPFGRSLHLLLMHRLRRHLRTGGFHLLHVHASRDLRFVVPASERLHPHLPILLTKHIGSFLRKTDPLHRYLYARVDLVVAISRVIRDNVIATCPIEPVKVKIIHNGVNLDRFRPTGEMRREARRALGAREEEMLIGMVGRLSPGKGHEEFLRAAAQIRARAPGAPRGSAIRFVVVGGASTGEEAYARGIADLSAGLGLERAVTFLGFRRDIPELMAALDILAFPSHGEAFGMVAAEAMAMGKPVVATNCDGVVDIVLDGVTGLQVPPRDSQALAEGLERLIADPALRARLGQAGRHRVEEMFDEKKQLALLVHHYRTLRERDQGTRREKARGTPPGRGRARRPGNG